MNSKAQAALATSIILVGLAAFGFAMMVITLDELDNVAPESTSETILTEGTHTFNHAPITSSVTANNQTWLEFDNDLTNGDNVTITNVGSSLFSLNENITLVAYVAKRANTEDLKRFFENGDTDTKDRVFMGSENDNINCYMNGSNKVSGNDKVSDDTNFHMLTCAFFSTGVRGYVDGDLDLTAVVNHSLANQTEDYFIGIRPDNAATSFNGSMDFFMLFNFTFGNGHDDVFNKVLDDTFVPVVMYHGISETCAASTQTCRTDFIAQMDFLNETGYETITFQDLIDWQAGTGFLPQKPIILTFDDGRDDVYTNATMILADYGFKGVAGVITNEVGASGRATWAQLLEMQNTYSWEIASHSYNITSGSMLDISVSQRDFQFTESRSQIIGNLSTTPITFIYPGNAQNSTLHTECSSYYSICTNTSYTSTVLSNFVYSDTHLIGEVNRFNAQNNTLLGDYKTQVAILGNRLLFLKFDENTGTTAYDISGNGNNGTISGATYNTDGNTLSLTKDTDFSIVGTTFTLLNSAYDWSQLTNSYTFTNDAISNTTTGYGSLGDYWVIIIITVVAGAVITIIFSSFRRIR